MLDRPTTVISVRGRDRAELMNDPNFVYVGRRCAGWPASVWGNPWKSGGHYGGGILSTYGAVNLYRVAIECGTGPVPGQKGVTWEQLRLALPELRGKVLGCWCGSWQPGGSALTCHAVCLAKLADGIKDELETRRDHR